jgi:putative membrane protein
VATLALVLVGVVAALHVLFMVLEAVVWKTPTGQRIFKMTAEQAQATAVLAMNQGLYNGFLAAGLVWSLTPWCGDPRGAQTFFCACVLVAGLVGAVTASRGILFLQALPGLAALVAVRLA